MPTWAVTEPVHLWFVEVPTAKQVVSSSLQDLLQEGSETWSHTAQLCMCQGWSGRLVGPQSHARRMMRVSAPSLGGAAGKQTLKLLPWGEMIIVSQ